MDAFTQIVREQVIRDNTLELDGLGYFKLVHEKQHKQEYRDGQVVLMPPRNSIQFIAEKV